MSRPTAQFRYNEANLVEIWAEERGLEDNVPKVGIIPWAKLSSSQLSHQISLGLAIFTET